MFKGFKEFTYKMVAKFDKLIEPKNLGWKILDILPEVLNAGEDAGGHYQRADDCCYWQILR